MKKIVECFPECFPIDLLDKIKKEGAVRNNKKLYRIGLFGENNERAWVSTFEEIVIYKEKPVSNKYKNDLDFYIKHAGIEEFSTSTFEKAEDADFTFKVSPCLKRYHKNGILLLADILVSDGYLKYNDSNKSNQNTHTHLWKFKNAAPWNRAKKVDWLDR